MGRTMGDWHDEALLADQRMSSHPSAAGDVTCYVPFSRSALTS